jgi:hypothetical protein
MDSDLMPYSSYTDEELLRILYTGKRVLSPVELELTLRLEHALDALAERPLAVGDMLTRQMIDLDKGAP